MGSNKIEVLLKFWKIIQFFSLENREYWTFNEFRRINALEKQNKTYSKCEDSQKIEVPSHKCMKFLLEKT